MNSVRQQLETEKDKRQQDVSEVKGMLHQCQKNYDQCMTQSQTAIQEANSKERYRVGSWIVIEVDKKKVSDFINRLSAVINFFNWLN